MALYTDKCTGLRSDDRILNVRMANIVMVNFGSRCYPPEIPGRVGSEILFSAATEVQRRVWASVLGWVNAAVKHLTTSSPH